MKTNLKAVVATGGLALVGALPCRAALSYATAGQTYNQSFDNLATSSSTWADDNASNPLGLGWYARTDLISPITTYGPNTGTTTTGGLYSFGSAASPADRALGFADSNPFTGASGTSQSYLGLKINNGTGMSLDQFVLGYTGEQWRRDNTLNQSLNVSYKLGASGVNDLSGWTTISTFTSPQVGSGSALDGNLGANRVVFSPFSTSLNWANGQDLWIRWVALNDTGNDHQLAIDDLSFSATAVPEASTWYSGIGLSFVLLGSFVRKLRK